MPREPSTIAKFVILSAPRSGSNMLCSMLNSHPEILCHHELFNPSGIFCALHLRDTDFPLNKISISQRNNHPINFLNSIWQHHQYESCVGFKMTHIQDQQVFTAVIADHSIKKIVLERRNVIKRYVSQIIAERNNIWEDYGISESTAPLEKIKIDADLLKQNIKFNQHFYKSIKNQLNNTAQTYLQLEYESLMKTEIQQKILNFLNLRYFNLTPRSRKQNNDDLAMLVSNYSDLLANPDFYESCINQ